MLSRFVENDKRYKRALRAEESESILRTHLRLKAILHLLSQKMYHRLLADLTPDQFGHVLQMQQTNAARTMSHPEFIEQQFDKHRAACQAGLQRAASPLTGLQGCPLLLSLSSRAAAGGTQKEQKEFLRGHPAPRQKALPSALPILELLL